MKRPPAGHASAGFSAIWALFTEVLPEGQDLRAGRIARHRAQARSARRQPGQRQRHQVHQFRLAGRSEGCRPESARLDRRLAVDRRPATSRCSRPNSRPRSRSWCRCRTGASDRRGSASVRGRLHAVPALPSGCRPGLQRAMTTFGQLVLSGMLIGGIYALMSIGLTLIFGVLRVVNFAHGEFLMLAMYGAWAITSYLGPQSLYCCDRRSCRRCSCSAGWSIASSSVRRSTSRIWSSCSRPWVCRSSCRTSR